jgi:hypothetical protein
MDEHVAEGYVVCDCGAWVLKVVARRTGGKCADCHKPSPTLKTLEIVGRGTTTKIRTGRHSKPRKRAKTPESKARSKLSEQAASTARRRLAAIFPEMYEMLLAEERATRGLEPWPLEIAVRNKGAAEVERAYALALAGFDKIGET